MHKLILATKKLISFFSYFFSHKVFFLINLPNVLRPEVTILSAKLELDHLQYKRFYIQYTVLKMTANGVCHILKAKWHLSVKYRVQKEKTP